jgi:hypothetical protein
MIVATGSVDGSSNRFSRNRPLDSPLAVGNARDGRNGECKREQSHSSTEPISDAHDLLLSNNQLSTSMGRASRKPRLMSVVQLDEPRTTLSYRQGNGVRHRRPTAPLPRSLAVSVNRGLRLPCWREIQLTDTDKERGKIEKALRRRRRRARLRNRDEKRYRSCSA